MRGNRPADLFDTEAADQDYLPDLEPLQVAQLALENGSARDGEQALGTIGGKGPQPLATASGQDERFHTVSLHLQGPGQTKIAVPGGRNVSGEWSSCRVLQDRSRPSEDADQQPVPVGE